MDTAAGTTDAMEVLNSTQLPQNSTDKFSMPQTLKSINDIIIPGILCCMMLSMACGVNVRELKNLLKKPFPAIIGLVSQFVVMPACAFSYAHALSLSPLHSIALVVVSSCPGGAISNVFTYWTRGDLALSIFMTLVSTVLALGFMPLNMFLYLRQWTDEDIKIPFVQNALIVVMTWLPVIIGLFIRYKSVRIANWFAKLGGALNMVFIIITLLLQNFMSPKFFSMSTASWIAGSTLPLVGFSVGVLTSSVACLEIRQRRTIAFETGIQNVGIAMALMSLSFDLSVASTLSQIPIVFAVGQISFAFLMTALHRIYFRFTDKKQEDDEKLENAKEGQLLTEKEQLEGNV